MHDFYRRMRAGVAGAFTIFMSLKPFGDIIGDSRIQAFVFTEEDIDEVGHRFSITLDFSVQMLYSIIHGQ